MSSAETTQRPQKHSTAERLALDLVDAKRDLARADRAYEQIRARCNAEVEEALSAYRAAQERVRVAEGELSSAVIAGR